MLTVEDRKYLANKHRGGVNNSKGNAYEDTFAVYQIAHLFKLYLGDYDRVILSSQIQDAFVDDFLISHPLGKEEYHQLKNVESLAWQSGSSHTLEYDFKRQKELLNEDYKDFSLYLVHSNPDSNLIPIPESISDCTEVLLFPYFEDMNRLILECIEFKDVIAGVSGYKNPTADQLGNIATILTGVWNWSGKQNISLGLICQRICKLPLAGNNFIFDPILLLNTEVKDILEKIPDFTFQVEGSTFHWTYKQKLNGEINKSAYSGFEKVVLTNRPEHFIDLYPLL